MPLDDLTIRTAKLGERLYKFHDKRGLFLLVNATSKLWRFLRREGERRGRKRECFGKGAALDPAQRLVKGTAAA